MKNCNQKNREKKRGISKLRRYDENISVPLLYVKMMKTFSVPLLFSLFITKNYSLFTKIILLNSVDRLGLLKTLFFTFASHQISKYILKKGKEFCFSSLKDFDLNSI